MTRALVKALLAAMVAVALVAHPAAGAERHDTTATVHVEGMTCPGCEQTVEAVLSGVDGVNAVSADRVSQTAHVTFDPSATTAAELAGAINTQTSYQASVLDNRPDDARPARTGGSGTGGAGLVVGAAFGLAALLFGGAAAMRRRSSLGPGESVGVPADAAGERSLATRRRPLWLSGQREQ